VVPRVLHDLRDGAAFVGAEVSVWLDRAGNGQTEETFVSFVYQPLRGADGAVRGILVHGADVTEQVRARARAAARTAELEATVEAMADGVVVHDTAGGIVRENAAVRRPLGPDARPDYERVSPAARGAQVRSLEEAEEVERVQAGLKSSLIMRQESTGARASQMASDWYLLGRVRSVEEIQAAIDGLSPKSIISHLHHCPPQDFTIVTLGPTSLTIEK